jgi:hypothetical protein
MMFGKVDCISAKDTCEAASIKDFPTILMYKDNTVHSHEGALTEEALVPFLRKFQNAAIEFLSDSNHDAWIKDHPLAVVVYVRSIDSPQYRVFNDVAHRMAGELDFGACVDCDDILEKRGVEQRSPVAIIYKPFDEPHFVLPKLFSVLPFELNIRTYMQPLMGELTTVSYMGYDSTSLPIGMLFMHPSNKKHIKLREELTELAREYRGKVCFTFVDAEANAEQMMASGMGENQVPSFNFMFNGVDHPLETDPDQVTVDTVRKFTQEYLRNEIIEKVKSLEPGESFMKGFAKIVTRQINPVLTEPRRVTILFFHQDECKNCTTQVQLMEEIAEYFFDQRAKILFGEFEAEKNTLVAELGFPISEFPHLRLIRFSDKRPMMYYGKFDKDEILDWIETTSEKHVTLKPEDRKRIDASLKPKEDKKEEEVHDEL